MSIALGTFEPGAKTLGIKDEGVGISPMTYTKDVVGPVILGEVEFLKSLLKAGTLIVPDTQEKLDAFVVPDITLP